MDTDPWVSLQGTILDQLNLQVELSFPIHHGFMKDHGLSACRRVLDLGTGNGAFLARLASCYPKIRFCGVDSEGYMIDAAKRLGADKVDWLLGDVNDLSVLPDLASVDGILMRYFILHAPNIHENLAGIARRARGGTALWVFDLDLNRFSCDPPHPAFDLIVELVRRFCHSYSLDSEAASRLPGILVQTGWVLDTEETEPFSNRTLDMRLFSSFLSQEVFLYSSFLRESQDSSQMAAIRGFIESGIAPDTHLVRYGMVMIAARRN